MFVFDTHKISFLNKQACELVALIEVFQEPEMPQNNDPNRSINNRQIVDWSDKFVQGIPLRMYGRDSLTLKVKEVKESFNDKKYGFRESNYNEVQKLINSILKDKLIFNLVSYEFIESLTIDWLFEVYKNNQISTDFATIILEKCNESIKEHQILFPVNQLEILGSFDIGIVEFLFFTKEHLKYLEELHNVDYPDDSSDYMLLMEKYIGQVFVKVNIKAEYDKALEIAFEECSLSIDIVKICSLTTIIPSYKTKFDIDKRQKFSRENEILIQDKKRPYSFNLIRSFDQEFYEIEHTKWKLANDIGLEHFHNFLLVRKDNDCELTDLIINSIKRYANAISSQNLHQRIVELYTILESLLLKNESDSILESVTNYCSKLIRKSAEDRKEIVKILKEMYKIRSSLIHHGKNKDFEHEKLSQLQCIVVELIRELIRKLLDHKTKESVLGEIDDAILRAY